MNDPYYGPAPLGSGPAPLVSGPFPVSMGDRGAAPTPNETLVFTTSDGSIVELPKRPGAFSAAKYSYRYVVNGGDHLVRWEEQLPSGTGGLGFQAALEARWRVASAAEVVRRNITAVADGEAAVCQAMREMLWPHTATYGIERLAELDIFVRQSFSGRPHLLDEGLAVTNLAVRLYLDPMAAEHLRSVKQREFEGQIAAADHINNKVLQGYQSELQIQREQAILAAARGEGGLMLTMIAQDPSKMREILAELADRHEIGLSHKQQVLKDLMDANLIQPAEAQNLWQDMTRPTPLFGGTAPVLPAAPASPQAQLLPGAVAPQSSKPPAPRYQGGGPSTSGSNAGGPATNGPNTSNAARPRPPQANSAGPNAGANSGPAPSSSTAPTPRFSSGPSTGSGPAPGSGSGSGSTAAPAPHQQNPGPSQQNPSPTPPAQPGGSPGSTADNVVGAVPVGRKHRANRSGT